MLANRDVHNDESPFIGSKRDSFPPRVPPPRKAVALQVAEGTNFPGLVLIHCAREPACSSRLFLTALTQNPTVGEEVVGSWKSVDGSCQLLSRTTVLRSE